MDHPPYGEAPVARVHPHVLIVEDEVGTASLIRAIVMRHGHGCSATVVGNGFEAMAYFHGVPPYQDRHIHPKPDLTILDLGLPGMSGLDVLTWMDQNAEIADSPVVVFSGSDDPEAARHAYALGARAFLHKSADPIRLVEVVRHVLSRWALEARDGTSG